MLLEFSPDHLQQALLAVAYYAGVIILVRLTGKRLAGQIATFDFVVLIGLLVALQQVTLKEGGANGVVFLVTVLLVHRGMAMASARWPSFKRVLRGAPRALVVDGKISREAMAEESVGYEELLAGLRKLGYASPEEVRLAMLEETGHISALPREGKA